MAVFFFEFQTGDQFKHLQGKEATIVQPTSLTSLCCFSSTCATHEFYCLEMVDSQAKIEPVGPLNLDHL